MRTFQRLLLYGTYPWVNSNRSVTTASIEDLNGRLSAETDMGVHGLPVAVVGRHNTAQYAIVPITLSSFERHSPP